MPDGADANTRDDRIQEKCQGRVTPDSWTHGSAEQRRQWFRQGYRTGDMARCNTFRRPSATPAMLCDAGHRHERE